MTADRSLVTIEAVERLVAKAHAAVIEDRKDDALFLLCAAVDETTLRTVGAQREMQHAQVTSDEISRAAADVVRRVMAALEVERAERLTPLEAAVRESVVEHYGDGGMSGFARVAQAVRVKVPGVSLGDAAQAISADLKRNGIPSPILSGR